MKACIKKKLVKRNKNKVSQKRKGTISNYFIPEKKCASQDLEEDFGASEDDEINITTSREIDLDLAAVVFEEDTILPETETVEVAVIKETNTDVKEHEECCTSTYKVHKCMGYMFQSTEDVSLSFPFQLLKEENDYVYENKRLHDKECFNNTYLALTDSVQIDVSENGDTFINKCCSDLQYSTKIQNISKNANDKKKHLSTCKNMYLTYEQLDNRIHHIRRLLSANQLRELNNNKN